MKDLEVAGEQLDATGTLSLALPMDSKISSCAAASRVFFRIVKERYVHNASGVTRASSGPSQGATQVMQAFGALHPGHKDGVVATFSCHCNPEPPLERSEKPHQESEMKLAGKLS